MSFLNDREELLRSHRVTPDSVWLSFANLHTGSGQLDQALKQIGDDACSASCQPHCFPLLVRFPVEPVIEQVEAEQVRTAMFPVIR